MGVKGLNWPVLFFFHLSLSLRKSLLLSPTTCCNEIFRNQNPSNSYMYMKEIIWLSITELLNNNNNEEFFN